MAWCPASGLDASAPNALTKGLVCRILFHRCLQTFEAGNLDTSDRIANAGAWCSRYARIGSRQCCTGRSRRSPRRSLAPYHLPYFSFPSGSLGCVFAHSIELLIHTARFHFVTFSGCFLLIVLCLITGCCWLLTLKAAFRAWSLRFSSVVWFPIALNCRAGFR